MDTELISQAKTAPVGNDGLRFKVIFVVYMMDSIIIIQQNSTACQTVCVSCTIFCWINNHAVMYQGCFLL